MEEQHENQIRWNIVKSPMQEEGIFINDSSELGGRLD
jgi:hypothetical protein